MHMKKLLKFIAVILVFAMNTATVSAYNFPQPDWGALLRDSREWSARQILNCMPNQKAQTVCITAQDLNRDAEPISE